MQEQSIIYIENINLNINEELKYHKQYGNLQTKEIIKKNLVISLALILITLCIAVVNNFIAVYGYVFIAIFLSIVFGFVYKSSVKKSIITMCKLSDEYAIARNSSKKITIKENGIETLTPYAKVYVPYTDIEKVISDPLSFSIKIRGNDKLFVIPKNEQNTDVLFSFDNVFREKLQDKFIYEM